MSSDGTFENPFPKSAIPMEAFIHGISADEVRKQYDRGFKMFTRKNVARLLGYLTKLEEELDELREQVKNLQEELKRREPNQ